MKASKTAAIANENPGDGYSVIAHDTGGGYAPGQVLFANDSRFLETYYSEPVTNYLIDWKDPNNIQDTLEFFAPAVTVGRRFEWKKASNTEEFLTETDDVRSQGADFKRVEYTGSDVTDKTLNKGLTYVADLDNVGVSLGGTQWQNVKAAKLLRRLYRNELSRAITLVLAAATNNAYTWDTTAGKNPDQDLLNDILTGETASGIRANRVVYGATAWNKRSISYGAQNNVGGYMAQTTVGPALAARLMVDQVMVSKERYQSSATAKSELLGGNVLAFYNQTGVDIEDPSQVKRFVSNFDAEQGGGLVRVYVQQISSKLVAITVEHYSKVVVTFSTGIRRLIIS